MDTMTFFKWIFYFVMIGLAIIGLFSLFGAGII